MVCLHVFWSSLCMVNLCLLFFWWMKVNIPPRYYCVIRQPHIRNPDSGLPVMDKSGMVKLRYGEREVRLSDEWKVIMSLIFPLFSYHQFFVLDVLSLIICFLWSLLFVDRFLFPSTLVNRVKRRWQNWLWWWVASRLSLCFSFIFLFFSCVLPSLFSLQTLLCVYMQPVHSSISSKNRTRSRLWMAVWRACDLHSKR